VGENPCPARHTHVDAQVIGSVPIAALKFEPSAPWLGLLDPPPAPSPWLSRAPSAGLSLPRGRPVRRSWQDTVAPGQGTGVPEFLRHGQATVILPLGLCQSVLLQRVGGKLMQHAR
jgi:hypothetical protein